ncbi:MAG: hypothetical protein PHD94_02140, partial [Synergistaceae bacterium]|nr:hypothetical protein [Synergistaceae bacterium]
AAVAGLTAATKRNITARITANFFIKKTLPSSLYFLFSLLDNDFKYYLQMHELNKKLLQIALPYSPPFLHDRE